MAPVSTVLSAQNGNETAGDAVWRPGFLPESVPGWAIDAVASIVVIVLAGAVARLLVRLFRPRLAAHFQRESLTRVSLAGVRAGVYVFGLLVLLRINGLDLGNIALSVTIFSAVVGVILAPIVGGVISGVFLLADQPYEIGDMIELTDRGTRGFVDDITLRYTKISTLENTFLVVPNGEMRQRDVVNYSAEDPRVRLTLEVLITYESDLAEARRRIEASARAVEEVIPGGPAIRIGSSRYPAAPDCLVGEFGDHGILLRLRYWITEPYRLQTVRSKVQTNVWDALEGDAIEIAYPHSHLVFDETSGELQVSTAGDGNRQPSDPARSPGERHEE
jgi:small-conductance mechanosensitive channel